MELILFPNFILLMFEVSPRKLEELVQSEKVIIQLIKLVHLLQVVTDYHLNLVIMNQGTN
jgi:hypothetical protein